MMTAFTDFVKPKDKVFNATPGNSHTLNIPTFFVGAFILCCCYLT